MDTIADRWPSCKTLLLAYGKRTEKEKLVKNFLLQSWEVTMKSNLNSLLATASYDMFRGEWTEEEIYRLGQEPIEKVTNPSELSKKKAKNTEHMYLPEGAIVLLKNIDEYLLVS